ncbi:MAG: acyltransferase family protein [Oscillospiraceae bacterium]|nr:acyltransferase family protein [Oscillospiraceae bacterium]
MQKRIWYMDNMKALLILLVVIGHATQISSAKSGSTILTYNIYLFHMPLFIAAAGYFSKRVYRTGEFPRQKAMGFLLLYLLLKTLNFCLDRWLVGAFVPAYQNARLFFLTASNAPWYLAAMIWWMLFTAMLGSLNTEKRRLQPGLLLILVTLAGIFIGYDHQAGDFLVFLRAIVFYPFFFAGVIFRPEWLEKLRRPVLRRAALAVLIVVFVLVSCFHSYFAVFSQLNSGRHLYENIAAIPSGWGGLYRLAHYLLASLIGLCIVAVMPNRRIPVLTTLGARTLQVYFWQSVVFPVINHLGWTIFLYKAMPLPLFVLCAAALALLLAWKPLGLPLHALMKPRLPGFLRLKGDG